VYTILNKKVEISNILKAYNQKCKIKVITTDNWYDVGHLNKYYEAKRKFLQSRFFNQLEIDSILNTITKKSERGEAQQKFIDEIKWYQNLPNNLKSFCPAIIEASTKIPYLKMEYIGYPTLSELWLYGNLSPMIWKNIISRLFRITDIFRENIQEVKIGDYEEIYIRKTRERIKKIIKINPTFKKILKYPHVIINGKIYKNFPEIEDRIYKKCQNLYNDQDNCIIHGDLCFSNILYGVESGVFKFIDPRGKWGQQDMAGDIKYDIAKLRHSIIGKYDFIINKLYSIEFQENRINMLIFSEKIHEEIGNYFDEELKKHWDLNYIKLIEGLLFISMLPLHNDDLERQLAFFAIGIKKLNEVLK